MHTSLSNISRRVKSFFTNTYRLHGVKASNGQEYTPTYCIKRNQEIEYVNYFKSSVLTTYCTYICVSTLQRKVKKSE